MVARRSFHGRRGWLLNAVRATTSTISLVLVVGLALVLPTVSLAPRATAASSNTYLTFAVTPGSTSLPAGGGSVTFTYTITSLGRDVYWNYDDSGKSQYQPYGVILDAPCTPSQPTTGTGWQSKPYGWYVPAGKTATLTCTATVTSTTTFTPTLSMMQVIDGGPRKAVGNLSDSATVTVAGSTPSPAPTPTAGACAVPTVYDAYNSATSTWAPTTLGRQSQGSTSFTPVGTNPAGWSYNALAYNAADGFLYGISNNDNKLIPGATPTVRTTVPAEHLLRIDPVSGVITDLGQITGFAAADLSKQVTATTQNGFPTGGLNAGFFDGNGTYWVSNGSTGSGGTGKFYKLDLTTRAASSVTQSAGAAVNDWTQAYGNYAWGIVTPADATNAGKMARVDLGTGAVAYFSLASLQLPAGIYGAAWTYGNGNLGFDLNDGGAYQIHVDNPATASPTFTLVSSFPGPSSYNNDGAACGTAAKTDLQITKKADAGQVAPKGTVSWTLVVTNLGPGVSSGATVSDTIPSEFSLQSATIDNGTCSVSGQVLTCTTKGNIDVGGTVSIRLSATAVSGLGTCPTNTATVLANEVDQVASNNTSSSSVCVQPAQNNQCSTVWYTTFDTAYPILGQVVDGSTVKATPNPWFRQSREARALAIDPTSPNYAYYGYRYYDSANIAHGYLIRTDLTTGTEATANSNSPAWLTNRLAIDAGGTIWSMADDGHLYSMSSPLVNSSAPKDRGTVTASGLRLDFSTLTSGDIALDGLGNMWVLASAGTYQVQDRYGNWTSVNAGTVLLSISASELTKTSGIAATYVGSMSTPSTSAYYNGIAFGSDGTLYASTSGNELYVVNPNDGSTTLKRSYYANDPGSYTLSTGGTMGDLASCAMPAPKVATTKSVAMSNGATTVKTGDVLTYTIVVENTGNLGATDVQVQDTIPAGTTYVPGSTTVNGAAQADKAGGVFPYSVSTQVRGSRTTNWGFVPANDKATITFQVTVGDTAAMSGSVCNIAGFQMADTNTSVAASNQVCLTVISSNINIAKTAGTVSGPDKDYSYKAEYTVTVANTGTADGTYGALTDTPAFAANLKIVSAVWTGASSSLSGTSTSLSGSSITGGPYLLAPAGSVVKVNETLSWRLTITFRFTDVNNSAMSCTGGPGGGLFNTVAVPAGQERGGTVDNSACLVPPTPPYQVQLQKQGANCDVGASTCPLGGAEFTVYSSDPTKLFPTEVGAMTPDASLSLFTSPRIAQDTQYWLVETKAPSRYQLLSTPIPFRVTSAGIVLGDGASIPDTRTVTIDAGNVLKLVVIDVRTGSLPQAGGSGTVPFLAVGMLLLVAAGAWVVVGRRAQGPRRRG